MEQNEQAMKISVIVAIYNVEKYLRKCIESILSQTYSNLEIICIDDGSTDNSGKLLDEYAKHDNRITVIHKKNGGVSSARNVGLEKCNGDFISFIDGDDWLEPDMYEVLISGITKDDIDISICGYFKDYDDRTEVVKNELPVPETPIDIRDFLKYIYIRDKYRGVASYLWNRIFRRSLFEKNNIVFDEAIEECEDIMVASECYISARNIVYNKKPLYHYVQRANSAIHDKSKKIKKLDACVVYDYIIDLYKKNNVDTYVIDYVKRFYVYHASLLLKIAFEYNDFEKIKVLKENINKYLDIYVKTNKEFPERVEEIYRLIEQN